MKTMNAMIRRNVRLFFKDKGMFFTALITPVILLVLYLSFLGNVMRDTLLSALPAGVVLHDKLVNGYVGGQLISSILAVSCVTVSFCSNMLMVQDRANGTVKDLLVSPVRPSVLSLSYYFATLISSLIVCLSAMAICLVYVASVGWYLSFFDVLCLVLDVFLLVMFGTALSSTIHFFLSTQGQISAVGTVISSGYGFVCGAYMPLSQFSVGLQRVLHFLPGTYGTVLVRKHAMRGVFQAMREEGISNEIVETLADVIDCNLYFFGTQVSVGMLYLVLIASIVGLIGLYVLFNVRRARKN